MKVKIQFYLFGILLFLGYNSFGQVIEVTQSFNSGVQAPVVGSVINAPGQGSNGQINITNTANVQYKARDIVHLKDGFHAGEFTGNGIFHAYIDENLILPADYSGGLLDNQEFDDHQISTSKAVGYIPATYNVGQTGAATYTIPIQIPPGTAGMVPSLSVGYNSQSGNGILGWGWSIGGLSAISRVPKTIYHNNNVEAVLLDGSDNFALDGQRLIKAGSDDPNYPCLYTEAESYSIVKTHGNISDGSFWFEVKNKNGMKIQFGNTNEDPNNNSKFKKEGTNEILFWLVNKISDQNGNYLKFYYRKEGNEIVIDRIVYTGNSIEGVEPYNIIEFRYEERNDANSIFLAGVEIESKFLLRQIKITANGQNFKSYKFNYGTNIYSFLREVQEFGSNYEELNSTIFQYGEKTNNIEIGETNVLQNTVTEIMTMDYDADGYSDILSANFVIDPLIPNLNHHTYFGLYQNNFESFQAEPICEDGLSGGSGVESFRNYGPTTIVNSDFDGDGIGDILISEKTLSGDYYKIEKFVLRHPCNQNDDIWYPPSDMRTINVISKYIFPGDFDGDGAMDVMTLLCNGSDDDGFDFNVRISFPRRNIFNLIVNGINAEEWNNSDNIVIVDFDGDGKYDIKVINGHSNLSSTIDVISTKIFTFKLNSAETIVQATLLKTEGEYSATSPMYYSDFNGDGKTDMVRFNNSSSVNLQSTTTVATIYFSKGDDSDYEIADFPLPDFSLAEQLSRDAFKIADYNSDGKSDILIAYNEMDGNEQISIYLFSGKGFIRRHYSFVGSIVPEEKYGLVSGDFNGDGYLDELLCRVGFQTNPIKILYFNKDSKERLLETVKNGFGLEMNFEYTWLSKETNYIPQSSQQSYPQSNFEGPISVVSSVSTSNGIGGYDNTYFKYKGATLNKIGKGFLGFSFIEANNSSTGITTQSKNWLKTITVEGNKKIYIPYLKAQKTFLSIDTTQILSSTIYSNLFEAIGTNMRYKLLPDLVIKNDYINDASVQTDYSSYDNDGNVLQCTTKFRDINATIPTIQTEIVEFGTYTSEGSWINWHPTWVKNTTTRNGGGSFSKKTSYTYDLSSGKTTSIVEFSDKEKPLITTLEYDGFGNTIKSLVSSNGLEEVVTKFEFDGLGRFPIKKYNTLNQFEEFTYDNRWGKPITVKGVSNLISTFEYDGWGRLKKSTDPLGNIAAVEYSWAIDEVENSLFKVKTSQPGMPETIELIDALGRERFKMTKGFGSNFICIDTKYNSKGSVATTTYPFFLGQTPITTTYSYNDALNRLTSVGNSAGSTNYSYPVPTGGQATIVITDPAGHSTSKTTDVSGKVISTTDYGGTLTYTYKAHGGLYQTLSNGSALTTVGYDDYGRQSSLNDINGGTTTYQYNAYGKLISQDGSLPGTIDQITFEYDNMGRPTKKTTLIGQTIYEYYSVGNGLNKIRKILAPDGSYQEYSYDSFGRTSQYKEKNGNFPNLFITKYSYNNYNQLISTTYPSGYVSKNYFDENGYLLSIKDGFNHQVFFANETNVYGQLTNYKLDEEINVTKTYNQFGFLERTFSPGIQDLETGFNQQTGNLEFRADNLKGLSENFNYDPLDRLKQVFPSETINGGSIANGLTGPFDENLTYSANGNITSKFGLGQYFYELTDHPNAVSSIENNHNGQNIEPLIDLHQQNVTYQNDRPILISENGYEYSLKYGVDDKRMISELKQNGTLLNRRFYSVNFERFESGNNVYEINYISGGDGLAAIYVKKNNIDSNYYYVFKDHLGSILSMTDANGSVIYEQNFDSWGKRRNPETWAYENSISDEFKWLNRGYTGHEHLYEFDLINMNARLYDPALGRFLAVDNYVQGVSNSQGYNRYSYCLNNPLKYTDPNGEWINFVIGAIMGGYSGYQIGRSLGKTGWDLVGYTWAGSSIGFLTAGIGSYVGSAVVSASGSALAGAVVGGAVAGGVSNASFSALAERDIFGGLTTGVITGGIGGIFSAGIGGGAGAFVGGAVAGGLGTAMNGGSPEQIGISAAIGGGVSYAGYWANMGYGYSQYNKKPSMGYLKFGGYAKICTAIQRSYAWGVEAGGNILANGTVADITYGSEGDISIPGNTKAIADFHTHPKNIPGPSWTDLDCQTVDQYVITSKNIYPVCMEDRLNILNYYFKPGNYFSSPEGGYGYARMYSGSLPYGVYSTNNNFNFNSLNLFYYGR